MMHPLFLLYAIDILLEKTAKVFGKASISGRTTAVVHAAVNRYALTFLYFFFFMGWEFCTLMCSWDKQYR